MLSLLKKIHLLDPFNLLYPFTCILCQQPTKRRLDLCTACEADLPWLTHCCKTCGYLMIGSPGSTCGHCLKRPPPYTAFFALWQYEEPIRFLIKQLKFHQRLAYSQVLGTLLAKKMLAHYHQKPDLIIPMPLHKKRLHERGFNQATLIAKLAAQKVQIPIDYHRCRRQRHTLAQSKIPYSTRYLNVKNAFYVDTLDNVNSVAIIDDVMTTGGTVNALSLALKKSGVKQIDVWCLAKTIRSFPDLP